MYFACVRVASLCILMPNVVPRVVYVFLCFSVCMCSWCVLCGLAVVLVVRFELCVVLGLKLPHSCYYYVHYVCYY